MKKLSIMVVTLTTLLTHSLQAKNISIEEKITGLYVAFFNRAADNKGLNAWKHRAQNSINRGGDSFDALKELSSAFSQHYVFISTYEHLDNRDFVEAIYKNALGQDGDEEGIINWINHLENGMSRSDMVANFVNSALSVDLTPQNFPNLTAEELELAEKRQNLITNKVTVAIEFTNRLGDKTDVSSSLVENDPAYLASIKIIANVTDDDTTVSTNIDFLNNIKNDTNPIDKINSRNGEQNQKPVANAGIDRTVTVNNSLSITGSGTDSDGTIIRYEWKKGSEVLGTTATITYIPTVVGVDVLTLTVTDNDGLTATDSINITVSDSTAHQIPILSDADKESYLNAINQARSVEQNCHSRGVFPAVSALIWSDKLYKASYEHTNDLVKTETFSHSGSGTEHDWTGYKLAKESSMVERVENYSYNWSRVGENIAAGTYTSTPQVVIQQWLESDGHCANLMNADFTEVGMAMVYSANSIYKYYWTQNFGTPR
jgi:uncharacterized protein YkwD